MGRCNSWCTACLLCVCSYQVQQLTVSVILLGIVLLLCPLASSFSELVAFSAAYGLVYGATVAIHITVLFEVVGVQRFGSALGFFMLIRSSGGLLGPPIAGEWERCFDSQMQAPSVPTVHIKRSGFQLWAVAVKFPVVRSTMITGCKLDINKKLHSKTEQNRIVFNLQYVNISVSFGKTPKWLTQGYSVCHFPEPVLPTH